MIETARSFIDRLRELAHLIYAGRAQTPSVYFRRLLHRYGPTVEFVCLVPVTSQRFLIPHFPNLFHIFH